MSCSPAARASCLAPGGVGRAQGSRPARSAMTCAVTHPIASDSLTRELAASGRKTSTGSLGVCRISDVMVNGSAADRALDALPVTFRFSDLAGVAAPESWLRSWLADGRVERVERGLYRRADAEPVDLDRLEIALRAPMATICLVSGLAEHDLVDDNPAVLDVAVPRGAWRPRLTAPVRWHSFAGQTFDLDRDVVAVDSVTSLGLYGPRRCIVDAFRLRHEVGPEVGVEALRRWLRRRGSTPGELLDVGRRFPAAVPSLTAALQVLG